ncbi:hypothetical protein [Mesorhizobium sp. M1399]|uniref:hypothetical protein n=1 Tax=Mesorhizobium sp. M1399 TaxID=2957096 RepID=UPI00333BBC12
MLKPITLLATVLLFGIGGAVSPPVPRLPLLLGNKATSPVPMQANLDHAGSLIITAGGTYSGRWHSDDPDVPAVTIRTTEPVTIENCVVSGVGTLISTRYGEAEHRSDGVNPRNTHYADVTVRNCRAIGQQPELRDRAPPRFIVALNPRRIDVQHNSVEGSRGIWVYADPARMPAREITVRFNHALNIAGLCRDQCSTENVGAWVGRTGIAVANFVQLADIREAGTVDISWNYVRNEPGKSAVEDVISLFRVRGRKDRPVTIANNLLIGAFPGRQPFTGRYSGSGIMIDGVNTDASTGSAWIKIFANRILYASNAGIGLAAGNNNEVFENFVVRPARYIDGNEITTKTVGIYVWKCCGEGGIDEPYFANVAHSNSIFVESYRKGLFEANNLWIPDCADDAAGATLCTGNESLAPLPVDQFEQQLLSDWSRTYQASFGRTSPVQYPNEGPDP